MAAKKAKTVKFVIINGTDIANYDNFDPSDWDRRDAFEYYEITPRYSPATKPKASTPIFTQIK